MAAHNMITNPGSEAREFACHLNGSRPRPSLALAQDKQREEDEAANRANYMRMPPRYLGEEGGSNCCENGGGVFAVLAVQHATLYTHWHPFPRAMPYARFWPWVSHAGCRRSHAKDDLAYTGRLCSVDNTRRNSCNTWDTVQPCCHQEMNSRDVLTSVA